jgi:hypothetical protein
LFKRGLAAEAGEAYERAAQEAQANNPPVDSGAIAQWYEDAARCYADEENWLKQSRCWTQVCLLRGWPYVRGQVRLAAPLFEDEYSQVEVLLQNTGASVARRIQVKGISSKFMLDTSESKEVRALRPQQDVVMYLPLRPKPNVRGKVKLSVTLVYWSADEREYEETLESLAEVRAHDEKLVAMNRPSPHDTTPHQIVYNAPGGKVVVGTSIEGDQIAEGGQKGDKVELNRSDRAGHVAEDEAALTRPTMVNLTCPKCGKAYLATVKYCQDCGELLR